MPSIPWNIITRNIRPDEQLKREIRQKIARLEPHEIAQITGQPLKQVKDTLATIQSRLREELLREEALL